MPWYQWILFALGSAVVVASTVLIVLLLSATSDEWSLTPSQRGVYIELCLQSANLVLTIAAVAVQPERLRALYLLFQYPRSPSDELATAIRAAFPRLSIEFEDQRHPTNSNIPLRKLILLSLLLNGQCFLQYPVTIILWVVPTDLRPYALVVTCLTVSCICSIVSFIWEWRLARHSMRFRAMRAESALEKYLVEDTTI
ncbi:unnamed protein product [Aphanomyces euteiches]|uniref:Integral membrane protein n=1 Tax=Aphanomyces euteiches TaxID=100861 RepID=A0A6G0WJ43_9STRA|nr:hypothetical protein Ae201684_014755 [Aphanomyces euteiches]KAH9078263.1 hypothetical protein Ae201684P_019354 [Aphanomyces euteiches]KAH9158007.1 hypothetical protein AeRB84_000245 [Aphanomyces euteiches]